MSARDEYPIKVGPNPMERREVGYIKPYDRGVYASNKHRIGQIDVTANAAGELAVTNAQGRVVGYVMEEWERINEGTWLRVLDAEHQLVALTDGSWIDNPNEDTLGVILNAEGNDMAHKAGAAALLLILAR